MPPVAQKTNVTFKDIQSGLDPNNRTARVIEMMHKTNALVEDMVVVEANDGQSHVTTIRTGLPTPTWRRFNQGVQPTKSLKAQIRATCGMLAARSEVDKKLADMNNNASTFRLSEASAHIEAMNQEMEKTAFYGNEKQDDATFTGLAAYYNTPTSDKTQAGSNIIKVCGAAAGNDQTSIFLVGWGENTIHGIYPKGSAAGLKQQDLGEIDCRDELGNPYRGYAEIFEWDLGLVVRDWRYGVRIANIDWSIITADPTSGALFDALDEALSKIPNLKTANFAFYCNREIDALLRKQARRHIASTLSMRELTDHRLVPDYSGVPFKVVDAILNTEAPL
jgi:hypothetical protein